MFRYEWVIKKAQKYLTEKNIITQNLWNVNKLKSISILFYVLCGAGEGCWRKYYCKISQIKRLGVIIFWKIKFKLYISRLFAMLKLERAEPWMYFRVQLRPVASCLPPEKDKVRIGRFNIQKCIEFDLYQMIGLGGSGNHF